MAGTLNTVSNVDLDQYLGTWFEICRLPLKWEDDAASDVTATYSLNDDGTIKVDNRCLDNEGKPVQAIGQAVPIDDTNAKLRVSFLPGYLRWLPFTTGDYWVIRLSEDYQVALVGTPDRKHLWLLSRTHDLDADQKTKFLATAERESFDLSNLITPRQRGQVVKIPTD